MKFNRKCIACGKEYEYCNSCAKDDLKPAWYSIFDCENCRTLFNTTTDYLAKLIDKEQAKVIFDECDLSYKNNLIDSIKNAIDEVDEKEKIKEINHKQQSDFVKKNKNFNNYKR